MSIKGKIAKKAFGNVLSKIGESAPEILNQVTESAPKLFDQIKTPLVKLRKESKDNKLKKVKNTKAETVVTSLSNTPIAEETNKPIEYQSQNVWARIGCSQKTIDFTLLALSDGIVDDKERDMLYELINRDGVDEQEFDFLLSKALEHFQKMAKNVIKELSGAFEVAEKMAEKEQKPNSEELMQALPGLLSISSNPFSMASSVSIEVIGKAIGNFIKEPSKLNTLKAEIIRVIDIPLIPEVLADFFSYANSQIIQETQKNETNGLFKRWSESLFGKDRDLVPIWKEKMNHVMDKAVTVYGNQPEVMVLFSKWRDSPLKQLMKLTTHDEIMMFPAPRYASDYIDVLQYSFQKSQDSNNSLSEAFCILCNRLHREGQALGDRYPEVYTVLDECRIRPVQELIANINNEDYLALFQLPERINDILEILQYLRNCDKLKSFYKQVYNQAARVYKDDNEAMAEIKVFKPKGLFGI